MSDLIINPELLTHAEERIVTAIMEEHRESPQLMLEANLSRTYAGGNGFTVYQPLPDGNLKLVGFVGEKIKENT